MSQPLFQRFYIHNLILQQTWEIARTIPVFKVRSEDLVTLMSLTEIVGLVLNPPELYSIPLTGMPLSSAVEWLSMKRSVSSFSVHLWLALAAIQWRWKTVTLRGRNGGPEPIDSETARTPRSLPSSLSLEHGAWCACPEDMRGGPCWVDSPLSGLADGKREAHQDCGFSHCRPAPPHLSHTVPLSLGLLCTELGRWNERRP